MEDPAAGNTKSNTSTNKISLKYYQEGERWGGGITKQLSVR